MVMFIRYKDAHKVINLNNFDELAIQTECYNKHHIMAKRYVNGREAVATNLKTCKSESDAIVLYEVLQHAWVSGDKVYEMD